MTDIIFDDHGSLILAHPLTNPGADWIDERLGHATKWGNAVVIEPRFVQPIIEGARADGLNVELT